VIFRLTAEEHRLLKAYAAARGRSPGQAARDLTLAGLRSGPAAPPTALAAARKAAFAVIVALSPDLDEQGTEELLREVFDQ
jgi:plasmid stability protein